MSNYQNQYGATPQIVNPNYALSQVDEDPQLHVADEGKTEVNAGEGKTEVKGLKEKIKEKLPGHHKDEPSATTAAGSGEEHPREKKGIMEKVKEKLPGLHH